MLIVENRTESLVLQQKKEKKGKGKRKERERREQRRGHREARQALVSEEDENYGLVSFELRSGEGS